MASREPHVQGSLSHESVPTRRPDVETYLLPDGTCLLFDPLAAEGHVLSVLGALVWDYCDGTTNRDEVTAQIAGLLPEAVHLPDEVVELLDRFEDLGLLLRTDAAQVGQSAS